jgi:ubiquinone/menaquinone biosynthesis C-methylase UbiE
MDVKDTGQISTEAAEVYDRLFVPALFGQFAPLVAEAAGAEPGLRTLDVPCGTGVLAREMHRRTKPGGRATGLDCNPGMLAVARRAEPAVEWLEGRAEALPFEDRRFDAVVSQFGLMFFQDRVAGLREMWRVLRPAGRMVVAVWDSLPNQPGFAALEALFDRQLGEAAAASLRAPFALGDRAELAAMIEAAGVPDATIETKGGTARFPSIEAWVRTEVRSWTLADQVGDEALQRLQRAAQDALGDFAMSAGAVAFQVAAHFIIARRAR